MHQKNKNSQRDDLLGYIERGNQMLPRERPPPSPTHPEKPRPTSTPAHSSMETHTYRAQLVPPGSRWPATTAPQTNTAPPSGREPSHAWLAATSSGPSHLQARGWRDGGASKVWGFQDKSNQTFWEEGEGQEAAVPRRPTLQVVFGNARRSLGTMGSESGANLCSGSEVRRRRFLSRQSGSFSFLWKIRPVSFFWAGGTTIVAGWSKSVCFYLTFIYIFKYIFIVFCFGENRVPHSLTRFSSSFGSRFVCHRVAKARNSQLKIQNSGAAESAKGKTKKKSRPATSNREITSLLVAVVVFLFFFY